MATHIKICTSVIFLAFIRTSSAQGTNSECTGGTSVLAGILRGINLGSCCAQINNEVQEIRKDIETLTRQCLLGKWEKGTKVNPGRSCRDIRQSGITDNGLYWINPDPDKYHFPIKVFCEMNLLGGGWIRVYNMMAKEESAEGARQMFQAISRNADVREVLSNSTSSAIFTRGLRLQEYTQAIFGWAESSSKDVTHYGVLTSEIGLKGVCYIDGFCGPQKVIGSLRSSVTGTSRQFFTGNDPDYPHVGIGYASQVIVWGYDAEATQFATDLGMQSTHWGNWNSDRECCGSGSTVDMVAVAGSWRYSILIR